MKGAALPRPPFLETERLALHVWQLGDAESFRPIASDPRVMRFISDGAPWPDARIAEFVERQMRQQRELGYSLFWLARRGTGAMLGFCGIQPLDGTAETEIGWWLVPDAWGQRLASEAARRVVAFAFGEAGLRRLVAIAQPANTASLRVMERIGMAFERPHVHRGIACVLYGLAAPGRA